MFKFHIHRFKDIETQTAKNVVACEVPIMRLKQQCSCGKIRYILLNIGAKKSDNYIWV